MKLTFEEVSKEYIDGVNINIDLGVFIDNWMSVKKLNGCRKDVANLLGISTIEVQIIEDKIRKLKVNLPVLKISA